MPDRLNKIDQEFQHFSTYAYLAIKDQTPILTPIELLFSYFTISDKRFIRVGSFFAIFIRPG